MRQRPTIASKNHRSSFIRAKLSWFDFVPRVAAPRNLPLLKGEADVAFWSDDTNDDELVGRKIAVSIWAIFASRG
jgi:hypothetical protein